MPIAVMSTKGQLVIPASLRHQADLKPGDRVTIDFDESNQILTMRKAESIDEGFSRIAAKVSALVNPATPPLEDPRAFYQNREPRS
ncbi:MAG: AbrB/MazE/SpoVT family DNA-binding domain-containing protein [Propionibacteriaceae bacterium]|nr:AbrB/MazE/SpoVT family DNA-binding domain-containing protein [Propionibacteriaceae bacterium]